MIKIILGLGSGLVLVHKISEVSYLIIAQDLAFILGWLVLFLIVIFLLLGLLGGWFLANKGMLSLLKIKRKDRVLIFSPHPDDETLAMGGLINELAKRQIPFKIVWIACGDGNPSLFWRDKKLKYSPAKFMETAQERRQEAIKAMSKLRVGKGRLLFWGYPDGLLLKMWNYPQKLITSKTMQLNHSLYFSKNGRHREYRGENLVADIEEILMVFSPTVIFAPHFQDTNPDHRAVSFFVREAIKRSHWRGKVYQYLIHFKWRGLFRLYPLNYGHKEKFLYPPRRLAKGRWFVFWLRPEQLKKKKAALETYKSQLIVPSLKLLFRSFLAQNEIFEEVDYSSSSRR